MALRIKRKKIISELTHKESDNLIYQPAPLEAKPGSSLSSGPESRL